MDYKIGYAVYFLGGTYITTFPFLVGETKRDDIVQKIGESFYVSSAATWQEAIGEAITAGFKHGDKSYF
jgi:hypothetical protein